MVRYRSAALFLLLALVWGSAFVAIKAGLADLPPVLFAAIRYDVAGVVMLAYVAVVGDDWWPRTRSDWVTVAVSATLLIALYNAFLFVGEQGVTSGVAAILVATSPVLTTVASRLALPTERLTLVGLAGLVLGFVGVGLVAQPDPTNLLATDLLYPTFVVLAALSVSVGSVVIQRVDAPISSEGTVAWSTALGALVLHAISVALPSESLADATFTPTAIVAVLYLAVLASAVGYVIYFDLLARVGAVEINLVSYAAPVVAAVVGWLLLGETLDPLAIVGFLTIFVGFVLVKRHALGTALGRIR